MELSTASLCSKLVVILAFTCEKKTRSFTQIIAQNDLLSAQQQPYVLSRVFAWPSSNPNARNSL